jgi:RHS repeat-associated protein
MGHRRLFGVGVDTPVVRISAAGSAVWYLTDYENTVTVMVNGSGSVIGRMSYDGFGKIVSDTTGASGDRYKYTGREWDNAVALQYNRARFYDPSIGKWTSTDPIGFEAGDANLYRYVGNSPILATDPTGLAGLVISPCGECNDPAPGAKAFVHLPDFGGKTMTGVYVTVDGRHVNAELPVTTGMVWIKDLVIKDLSAHRVYVAIQFPNFGDTIDAVGTVYFWGRPRMRKDQLENIKTQARPLIDKLGSALPRDRDDATAKLLNLVIGVHVLDRAEILAPGMNSLNAEIRARCKKIELDAN